MPELLHECDHNSDVVCKKDIPCETCPIANELYEASGLKDVFDVENT